MIAMAAMCCGAFGGIYQVYDFTMDVKTTKAKGVNSASCGLDYFYRDKTTVKIQGLIAGCGCGAINADGSVQNPYVVMWNATTKTQITNIELTAWIVQRINKNGSTVEHIADITTDDFHVMLGGFGPYKENTKDSTLSYISSISGKFGGYANAPFYNTKEVSKCCGYSTPASTDQTMAVPICEDGTCSVTDNSDITPFFGVYTLKYNSSKSAKAAKYGINEKNLGLPSYVKLELD